MRTAYCPKTHRELSSTSVGTEFGHTPGHQYNDVDVVISQSRDGKFRCHIVESWGSAQGYDEEHGRREAIGRGESISEAAHDAKQIALEAGVSTRYLTSAVSKAIDEALEATQPTEVSLLTPDNCGASQIACNIVNNTFLSLDGFESMRKQMAGTDYTAEHFGAELARIVDRELKAATNELGNAGCDKCGTFDRVEGSKLCESCTPVVFSGKNYSIELDEGLFVLINWTSANETFDSFEELVGAHPICEEARSFFFEEA